MSAAADPPGHQPSLFDPPAELPERLVLFDGVCGFCDRAVRWLVARDPEARLHFAPLQGETAAALRRRFPSVPDGVDTMVYVEPGDGAPRVHLRSAAVFRALAEVAPGHPLLRLAWLPRAVADLGYRLFARLRYRLFGVLDSCRVPTAEERSRFLP